MRADRNRQRYAGYLAIGLDADSAARRGRLWIWAERIRFEVHWLDPSRVHSDFSARRRLYLRIRGDATAGWGRRRQLCAALWVAFSAAGAISTYLAATFAMPLRDAQFVAIDSSMGFH